MLDIQKKAEAQQPGPPQRWFILEEFDRQKGIVWTVSRRGSFFGLFTFWRRPISIFQNGEPNFVMLMEPQTYDNFKNAKYAWERVVAWEQQIWEKYMRKKFPSRIVFPIFVEQNPTIGNK